MCLRLRAPLSLALALMACPADPAFVTSELGADTQAATDAMSVDTAPEVAVDGAVDTTDAEVALGVPCARDCIVRVTDEPAAALAALVDAQGRATVVVFREPGPGQFHLALRRFDGGAAWPLETLSGSVVEPIQIAAGLDEAAELHVLAEFGAGLVASTSWYRRAPGSGSWSAAPIASGRRCKQPRFARAAPLYAACVDDDELELVILRLAEGQGGLAWNEVAVLPEVGWLSRLGFATFLPWGFDVDVLGQPHAAWSCCGPEPTLGYAWWDGSRWRSTVLGAFASAAGTYRRSARLALDGAGHPHVVHQQAADGIGELVDHAYREAWEPEPLARADTTGTAVGELLELVPDRAGRLHLVYQLGARLVYRVFDGAWSASVTATIDVDPTARRIGLTLADDAAHVVFPDAAGTIWWWTPAVPDPLR